MGRILKGSIGVVFSSSRDRPRGSRPHRGSHAAEAPTPSAPLSLPHPTVPLYSTVLPDNNFLTENYTSMAILIKSSDKKSYPCTWNIIFGREWFFVFIWKSALNRSKNQIASFWVNFATGIWQRRLIVARRSSHFLVSQYSANREPRLAQQLCNILRKVTYLFKLSTFVESKWVWAVYFWSLFRRHFLSTISYIINQYRILARLVHKRI